MNQQEERKLPEAEEITVKLALTEAKEVLEQLPPHLNKLKDEIEKGIKRVEFWNFMGTCRYLESVQSDFHLMGLMNPAWHVYCKHPENKSGTENLYLRDLSKRVKDKVTGKCEKETCPIY